MNLPPAHSPARPLLPVLLWLALVAVALGIFVAGSSHRMVDTDILHLLPQVKQKALVQKAQQQLDGGLQQTIVWLARGDSRQQAVDKATALAQTLQQSGLFQAVELRQQAADNRVYQQLLAYRFQLLDPATREALADDSQAYLAARLQSLFSPLGMAYAATLQLDPAYSYGRYINQLYDTAGAEIYNDVTLLRDGEHWYALLLGDVQAQGFAGQKALATLHASLAGDDILAAGLPLYSAYGAQQAEQEISLVGTLSVIAIVLFMLAGLRSLRPLLLALLSIAVGVLAAWALCVLVFGRLHVITLVFGSSLIGISVDYSFHYFCDRLRNSQDNNRQTLRAILPGISLGLGSSVIAYGVLLLTPFPGLQQIGLFSVAGLLMAWLTVVLLYPSLAGPRPRHRLPLAPLFAAYLARWPAFCRRHRYPLLALLLLWLAGGLLQLQVSDDIRSLQQPDAGLLAQEKRIAAIGRQRPDGQFFIVSGADQHALLAAEQKLLAQLAPLQQSGRLARWQALSGQFPSPAQQQQNYRLLQQQLIDNGLLAGQLATVLQMRPDAIAEIEQQFAAAASQQLALADWVAAVGEPYRPLWLGCEAGSCSSIVRLYGIADVATLDALAALADDGVLFVDRVQTFNQVLAHYRHIASTFLLLALGLIWLFLAFYLGPAAALQVVLAPLAALLLTVATLALAGQALTMFHVFGLLLALGIGLDYAIFCRVGGHGLSTAMAVVLSLLTSLLAFGLLATSSTAFIQAFGLSLALGIFLAFLLAPLVAGQSDNKGESYVD